MSALAPILAVDAPSIDYDALLPYFILIGGAVATILVSLLPGKVVQRGLTPLTAVGTLVAAGVLLATKLGERPDVVLTGALRIDGLAVVMSLIFIAAALVAIALAWGGSTVREAGHGEVYSLLIAVVLGMALLAAAQNLVTVFLALELFSIPLYVLCGADLRRNRSLESGVKYLIIGSLGSATMLYGMAFIFGATGVTDFDAIADAITDRGIGGDSILLVGLGLTLVGIAFKASIAPFHQWTPDVYQGAPTPITAFMAVATKAAAFALMLRLLGDAFAPLREDWAPLLAVLAAVTIVIGNVGAMRQESLKRMLAYSGVAQAGYLLVGVVVASGIGTRALVFYLLAYMLMNLGPFAVIVARERAGASDGLRGLRNLGREAPALAWSMTIGMITLAGLPITAGFVGKLFLIEAAVDGDYAWLAVAIVVGSAMSLVYYLKVVAAIWMTPQGKQSRSAIEAAAPAGAAPEADSASHPELVTIAVLAALASVLFGVWPAPLLDLATYAAEAFMSLGN